MRRSFHTCPVKNADHMGGEMRGHRQVVADHDRGQAEPAPRVIENVPEKMLASEIHARGRLVQKEELRSAYERLGQKDPAQLPSRKIADPALCRVTHVHFCEHIADGAPHGPSETEPHGAAAHGKGEKLTHGHGRAVSPAQILGNIADAAVKVSRFAYGAGVGHLSEEAEQERRLACAVRAHKHGAPSGRDGR